MKFLIPLLILLTGCSIAPEYNTFQVQDPSAKLRIVALTKNTNAFYVPNSDCEKLYHFGTLNNFLRNYTLKESSIGIPWANLDDKDMSPKDYREVTIPANKDFHLYYTAIDNSYFYTVNAVLKPEENKLYQINMSGFGASAKELVVENDVISTKAVALTEPNVICK